MRKWYIVGLVCLVCIIIGTLLVGLGIKQIIEEDREWEKVKQNMEEKLNYYRQDYANHIIEDSERQVR